uniref:Mitochondrial fission factor n=1 Tax=Geospiza parvula TaxID=87175 RepID=A0A8U8CD35_GEOPR
MVTPHSSAPWGSAAFVGSAAPHEQFCPPCISAFLPSSQEPVPAAESTSEEAGVTEVAAMRRQVRWGKGLQMLPGPAFSRGRAPAVPLSCAMGGDSAPVLALQLARISGRLRVLEEQCHAWRQKEALVYSVMISACLINTWLWLRR